jgi:ABC-type branched-subunit amino acid transport system ATPase component
MDEPTEGLAPVIVEALTGVLIKLRRDRDVDHPGRRQNSRVALAPSRSAPWS